MYTYMDIYYVYMYIALVMFVQHLIFGSMEIKVNLCISYMWNGHKMKLLHAVRFDEENHLKIPVHSTKFHSILFD